MKHSIQQLKQLKEDHLAPYALTSTKSKGRQFNEINKNDKSSRLIFQTDRDRIMHSRAFRRLSGKTQVFIAHHGDHYRTRLTHSLEVAQISRDIARSMNLNEDLAESIALAHDLGHTPFGHAGQDALNEKMQEYDLSFEHNEQSKRVVETLENNNPNFRGLNLSFEILEGLMKHKTSWDNSETEISIFPSLEAQIVNLADEIAYNSHDIDDGLRSGIINLNDINKITIWKQAKEITIQTYGSQIIDRHLIARTISNILSLMINDVLINSSKLIIENKIQTLDDVYKCKTPLIAFSNKMLELITELKMFLYKQFYLSETVTELSSHGQEIIKTLFDYYIANPTIFKQRASADMIKTDSIEIQIKDYIAGMTDQFAKEEFNKI